MWQLVRMQLERRWKQELLILGLIIFCVFIDSDINITATFLLILRATLASTDSPQLLKQLLTMPILPKHIINGRYIYEALSFYVFIVAYTSLMVMQQSTSLIYAIGIFTTLIIIFNTLYAQAIYVEFSTIKNASYTDYIFGIFPAAGLVIIHLIFIIIEMDQTLWKWLLLLPMPVLSFIFFIYYYKRACKQLPQKEFA